MMGDRFADGRVALGGFLLPFAVVALLAGCAAPESAPEASAPPAAAAPPTPAPAPAAQTPPPAPVAAAPAPPPPPVLPYDEAVLSAATALMNNAKMPPASSNRIVIDPLIDGVTGAQTVATRSLGSRIEGLIKEKYPQFEVQPFTASTVQQAPLVLIGTFTGVNDKRQTSGLREAYRICLALADLKTGKLVSKGLAFAQMQGVDATPLPFYRDAPALVDDPATVGYVRTCQGTKAGDPINPAYLERIGVATTISEAIDAYGRGRYKEALELYGNAAQTPEGKQLRVYNGLYLANWKLGRRQAATRAFGDIVDFGLEHKKLATKFLFNPGSTSFYRDRNVSGAYPMWLHEIADRAAKQTACIEITGHTSPTGPEPVNERLSQLRAEFIKGRLQAQNAQLAKRLIANGVGSRETLIGTGKDDASDSLDRRVEFKVIGC